MSIKEQLHQLLDDLDADSAEEARAYLQSCQGRYGSGETRSDVVTATVDPSRGQSRKPVKHDLVDHLIDALDQESAVEALAYLQSLCRPRLLSEAGIDDEAGTEEEREAAVEAWQLDRRHALDER
jgi:hypothetical protein